MSLTDALPLSRSRIDRDAVSRKIPGFLEDLWAGTDTAVIVIWRGEALLQPGSDRQLAVFSPADIPTFRHRIYLGRVTEQVRGVAEGTAFVAAVLGDAEGEALEPDVSRWMSARTMAHTLDDRDSGLVIEALAMANWHDAHAFSPVTGAPALPSQAGWTRVDKDTGKDIFPRTDAAVIVLITDGADRIVLGSNALWESHRYSLLAGFVEPGESLEAAVVREVWEESGLLVHHPRYLGSQPWPFPASLMVGFHAQLDPAHANDLRPDGTEIVDLRWFTRDELLSSDSGVTLPGPPSIARSMIDAWLNREIA